MSMVRAPRAPSSDLLTDWAQEYFRKNGWIVIFTIIVFYYSKKWFLEFVAAVKYYTIERRRHAELDRERERVRRRQLEEIERTRQSRVSGSNSAGPESGPSTSSDSSTLSSSSSSTHSSSSTKSSESSHSSSRASSGGSRRRDDCDDNNPFGSLLHSGVGPTGIKYRPRRRGRY